jgi:hypothetical protein
VYAAGIGLGVGVDGLGAGVLSFTLDAVTDPELQLPVPVSVLLSPAAGLAPDGVNTVDEFVKMWR